MHLDEVLIALVILLSVAAVSVVFFTRLGLGSVLGYLATGAIVGPSGLAIATDAEGLRHITELGVVLLLFVIGLEMEPRKLWSMRRSVFGLGSAQVLVTGAVIAAYAMLIVHAKWNVAILLGFGLALSSTAFVLPMLHERGEFATEHGKATFSILLLQDISIVPLLALVPLLSDQPVGPKGAPFWQEALIVVALLAGVFVVGRYVLPLALDRVAKARNRDAFAMLALLAALAAALAMELVGISMALGAFMMGMLLSASDYRHQIEAEVEHFKGVLLPLFFVSVGMSIDFDLFLEDGLTQTAHVIAIIAIKAGVLFALCLLLGYGRTVAIRASALLAQCGEFGFVLFGAAVAAGLISDSNFAVAILVISLSMVLTPLVVKLGDKLAARYAPAPAVPGAEAPGAQPTGGHVVVAGYGRVGRIVCLMLEKAEVPYFAIDNDPNRIAMARAAGHHVHYGDITDTNVQQTVGLDTTAGVVVTLPDMHAAERLVSTLRNFYPGTPILVRAPDLSTCDTFLAMGVARAFPIPFEGSLQLGAAVLRKVGVLEDDVTELIEAFRGNDYALVRQPAQEAG